MVGESGAARGKAHAGSWGHHAAESKGVSRARKTRGGCAQGKDINSHQMQKVGRRHQGACSSGASLQVRHLTQQPGLVGLGFRLTQRQKRCDSHSNEVPTPSPERLCLQKPLGNVSPSLPTPATVF